MIQQESPYNNVIRRNKFVEYTIDGEQYENKLFTEFMGWIYFPQDGITVQGTEYPGWFESKVLDYGDTQRVFTYDSSVFISKDINDINFKEDWNILIKVVDKIESLKDNRHGGFTVTIEDDHCLIQSKNISKESAYSKLYKGLNKIGAVYRSCLMFIEWYNNGKS